jgi:ABC-type sugar transport system substrate-binding protein
MRVPARRLLATLALSSALSALSAVPLASSPAQAADPIGKLTSQGAPYVIFIVKDLGGGAYWNVTTSSMYALATGTGVLIDSANTGADLLATLAANGRDLLLLINGAVLHPIEQAVGG